jgi:hypothetical protein
MMDQKPYIKSFINKIFGKDYAAANKDLRTVVEAKLKEKIAKATKKDLF